MRKEPNLLLFYFFQRLFSREENRFFYILYVWIYIILLVYGYNICDACEHMMTATMVIEVKVVHALETEARYSLHVSYLMNVLWRRAYLFSFYVPILARVRELSFIFLTITLLVLMKHTDSISLDFSLFFLF